MFNQLNINGNNSDELNQIQSINNNPKIIIEYNNIAIHTITGPVPVVDISYSINANSNNLPETLVTSINLNGKIFRFPEGNISNVDVDKAFPGFSGIIAGVSGLKQLFTSCPYGTLKFKCEDNILYEVSGLSVRDMSFSNTADNWVQSADYTISLETNSSLIEDSNNVVEKYVTDRSDSWSVEPLDDVSYTNVAFSPTMRPEFHNPNLGLFNDNNPINLGLPLSNGLNIVNIPQFRITRRLSAKGILPPKNQICATGLLDENTKPYVLAKAWVEKMSQNTFTGSTTNSSPYIKIPFEQNLFAFNHNRTISMDIFNGTYETNDTWLAMPSGVPYTETYTIECSTGEDYVKTVRVAGNIEGLVIVRQDIMEHESGVLPTGIGDNGLINAKLDLSYANNTLDTTNTQPYNSTDTASSAFPIPPQYPPTQNIKSTKIQNALNAWINHIKPYLYRRASLGINSPDRKVPYIPAYVTDPPSLPNNPIFSRENLLSAAPVSTSESFDPKKGTINYSYEFNNKQLLIPGVISENISVTYDNPVDSTAETFVIGRALGPIIQRTGRTSPKKSINIEIAIPPASSIDEISLNNPKCPLHYNSYLFKAIEQIIEAHRPYSSSPLFNEPLQTIGLVYISSDNENWNPQSGRYSRSISWVYQQCNLGQSYRDH